MVQYPGPAVLPSTGFILRISGVLCFTISGGSSLPASVLFSGFDGGGGALRVGDSIPLTVFFFLVSYHMEARQKSNLLLPATLPASIAAPGDPQNKPNAVAWPDIYSLIPANFFSSVSSVSTMPDGPCSLNVLTFVYLCGFVCSVVIYCLMNFSSIPPLFPIGASSRPQLPPFSLILGFDSTPLYPR